MAWFDWIKDIPLAAVLKEKVTTLEAEAKEHQAEKGKLESQIQTPEKQVAEARAEAKQLKATLSKQERSRRYLEPEAEKILLLFTNQSLTDQAVMKTSGLSRLVFEHHWKIVRDSFSLVEYEKLVSE